MVNSTVNQVVYNGDGITTAWPYTFEIIDATDIRLTILESDGTKTDVTSNYYVDVVNSTVYYPGYAPGSEPPEEDQPPKLQSGQKIRIYRKIPVNQLADLGEKWPFTVIEKGLDKLTMLIQDTYGWFESNLMCLMPSNDTEYIWDAKGYPIKNVGGPASVNDAATKDYVDSLLNGFVLAGDSRTVPFDTVLQMKAADLETGQIATTLGYDDINDGGAGVYAIRVAVPGDVDDGGSIIILDNGKVAELIVGDTVSVKLFGAAGDGVTDDTTAFKNAVAAANGKRLLVPSGTYVINSSIFADDVADVDDNGTYSNVKPAYPGTELMFKSFRDMGQIGVLTLDAGYGTQGFCYNSTTDRYLVASKNGDDSAQKILVVNPSDLSVESTVSYTALGHINTLTYVPEKNEVYVVTGRSSWWAVSVLDGTTLAIKREITDVVGRGIGGLKFDSVTKLFYGFDTQPGLQGVYHYTVLDIDLNIIKTGTFNATPGTSNGLCVHDGNVLIFMLDSIVNVDFFGNVKKVINHKLREEFEDADYTPYGIIVNANSSMPGACLFKCKENTWQMSESMLPASIESKMAYETKLNTVVNTGNYYVSIAHMENVDPSDYNYPANVVNGMLWVSRLSDTIANGFIRQVLFRVGDGTLNTTSWQAYTRLYHGDHNAWSNWVRIDSGLIDEGETSVTVSSNSYADKTITFAVPFSTVPHVQISMCSTSTSMDFAKVTVAIVSVSTTQLELRAYNGGANSQQPNIWWRATER